MPGTLLIAVRDLVFRSRIEAAAREGGVATSVAPRGQPLVPFARTLRPAAVLADLGEPGMAAELATLKRELPELRVVAFASHVREDLFAEARAAGIDEVLTRGQLTTRIGELLLGVDPGGGSAPRPNPSSPPGIERVDPDRSPGRDRMSSTVELTASTFDPTLEKGGIVLIDWWAPWCGPCRAFGPAYEKVAARHPDITFAKVNTEVEQQLAAAFEIRSIPTLMVLREKVLLFAQPGALPETSLEDLIRQVRALDMEKVRAEIAEQAEPGPEAR